MEADDAVVVVDEIVQDSLERNDLVVVPYHRNPRRLYHKGRVVHHPLDSYWDRDPNRQSFLLRADHSFVEVGVVDSRLPSACRLQWAALGVLHFPYSAVLLHYPWMVVDHPTHFHLVVRDDLSLFSDPNNWFTLHYLNLKTRVYLCLEVGVEVHFD